MPPAAPAIVRVRVKRGFQGYVDEGEVPPTLLPGAVIDLKENVARAEIHRGRVEEVDATTTLVDGTQLETTGETAEEIAARKKLEAAQEPSLEERIAKAVAAALAATDKKSK